MSGKDVYTLDYPDTHDSPVAIDEYHNIRRPRNPDRTIDDLKHWFPLMYSEIYQRPPEKLLRHVDEPAIYAVVNWRFFTYAAAGPLRKLPKHNVIQAVFSVLWIDRAFGRGAPKAAAAALYGAVIGAGGEFEDNARIAYLPTSGNVRIFTINDVKRFTGIYAEVRKVAERIAEALAKYAIIDDRLMAKIIEIYNRLDEIEYYNIDIIELASIDPEAALALPVARLIRREVEELLRLVFMAKDKRKLVRRVKELYESGMKVAEIAKELGVSIGEVYNLLRLAGIEPSRQGRRRAPRLTPEEEKKIVEMRKQRMPITEIARATGRSVSTVWRVLVKHGVIEPRPRRRRR